jgi:hypothetical protein
MAHMRGSFDDLLYRLGLEKSSLSTGGNQFNVILNGGTKTTTHVTCSAKKITNTPKPCWSVTKGYSLEQEELFSGKGKKDAKTRPIPHTPGNLLANYAEIATTFDSKHGSKKSHLFDQLKAKFGNSSDQTLMNKALRIGKSRSEIKNRKKNIIA